MRKQYSPDIVHASSAVSIPAPVLGHHVSLWRRPLIIRRVAGNSMEPNLRPGQLVVGRGLFLNLRRYDVVIVRQNGLEKVKRITQIKDRMLFLEGDNPAQSTDSRHFGWIPMSDVVAKVLWPAC